MRTEIEDFGTGWYGIRLQLKDEDIDRLIEFLRAVKADPAYHFHVFSTAMDDQKCGIADIEFAIQSDDVVNNADVGA